MTTRSQFRTAFTGVVETWQAANFPNLPVVYENGPVPDQDKIGPIWLDVEIRWFSGHNIEIGENARGRYGGALSLNVFSREATGTQAPDGILESLETLLKNRHLGGGRTHFPHVSVSPGMLGWYRAGMLVPFTFETS